MKTFTATFIDDEVSASLTTDDYKAALAFVAGHAGQSITLNRAIPKSALDRVMAEWRNDQAVRKP